MAGVQIIQNHIRPHMALDGKTPAEIAGIKVEEEIVAYIGSKRKPKILN
ncbi:MAG TPA: hypothetical protein VEG61_02765 [Candidatus Dormibacteraeota bacterium]|nr:hypothetical protein [Candidatus Dormibacteraeota bacterium]